MMRKKERKIKRSFRIHRCLSALGMILVLGLSACQKSPESSIVVNKDMDNLIDEAQNGENGIVNVDEVAEAYDSYQVSLSNESLGVTITGEAKVDIPKTDQMSVLRVKQSPITQELLDKVKQELVQGETLYDERIFGILTRSEVEQMLQSERNSAANEDALEEERQWAQERVDILQELYENAPLERDWERFPSDGQIHTGEELYGEASGYKDQQAEVWFRHEQRWDPSEEIYAACSNGKDGRYIGLWVLNNPDRGNFLRYRLNRSGLVEGVNSVAHTPADLDAVERGVEQNWMASPVWKADSEQVPQFVKEMVSEKTTFYKTEDADATLSEKEAVEMADAFLETIGLDGFAYYSGGLFYEANWFDDLDGQVEDDDYNRYGYQKLYILSYMRNIDGAFTTYDPEMKLYGDFVGDKFVKKEWLTENIEIRINDDGIVGFDYNAPLEVTETVVEGASMKSFDEIKSTFETMAAIQNADPNLEYYQSNGGEPTPVTIEVDRVVLGYARISEADSFDTGLLVPVWDFRGTVTLNTDYNSQSNYCSILTINAIDGSIIDRSLGY